MLPTHLATLEAAGLIRRAQPEPDLAYGFRHVLVREAAYASLLKADRRALHLAVGEVLEALYATQLDEVAPALAHHFAEAQVLERAWRYARQAGELATHRYANPEAVAHFQNAVQWARDLPLAPADYEQIYLALGRGLELTGRLAAALEVYQALADWAHTHVAPKIEFNALMAQATLRCTPNVVRDPVLGEALAQRALVMAHALGDQAAAARVHWLFLLVYRLTRQMADAQRHGEQSIALARALGLTEQLAFSLNDMVFVYLMSRQLARSQAVLAEARTLWETLGNWHMLSDNMNTAANVALLHDELLEALRLATENDALARQTANLWGQAQSQWLRAGALLNLGRFTEGLAAGQASLALSRQSGFTLGPLNLYAQLVAMYADLGLPTHTRQVVQEFLAYGEELLEQGVFVGLSVVYAMARVGDLAAATAWFQRVPAGNPGDLQMTFMQARAEVELQLAQGHFAAALARLDQQEVELHAQEFWFYLLPVLERKGYALLQLGRLPEAAVVLTQAHTHAALAQNQLRLWLILKLELALAQALGGAAGIAARQAELAALTATLRAHMPPAMAEEWER